MVLPCLFAAFAVACGGDDEAALPSVPESAVPNAEPTVGADAPVTLANENCLRADGITLVFVDGRAEMTDTGAERRLEVNSMSDDGGASLASVPVDGVRAVPVLGHLVEPVDWAEEPPEGCDGPYFLVTDFDIEPG